MAKRPPDESEIPRDQGTAVAVFATVAPRGRAGTMSGWCVPWQATGRGHAYVEVMPVRYLMHGLAGACEPAEARRSLEAGQPAGGLQARFHLGALPNSEAAPFPSTIIV